MGVGVWVGRLAIAVALVAGACAQNNGPTDPFAAYDPNDPFSDPFFTEGFEGLNIDDEDDFARAEQLVADGRARLVDVPREPYPGEP